jgi:hypothetical protein
MRKTTTSTVVWVALLAVQVAVTPARARDDAASPADTLWSRAVALAGRNLRWVPGLIVARTEEVDDEGRAKSVQESWVRLRPGDDGAPVRETVKYLKNGKDETEKVRREEAEARAKELRAREQGSGGARRFGGPTPFDPEVQDSVTYRRLENDPAAARVAYEFALQTAEEVTIRGTAWLADPTGVPLELRFTTDPLPKRVKEMSARVGFAAAGDSAWWATEMSFEAMGKLLIFKKRFRSRMTFDEYWRLPTRSAAPR